VELNRVIADFEKLLRRMIREDIEIQLRLLPSTPKIRADVGQIEQVIMNLAVNAQDAMPGGGHLIIETDVATLEETSDAEHHDVQPGTYVVLAVHDTGEGMDAKIRERIFDPFFTTKEKGKGTGLGLATVYGIVKQHGGGIRVYSEPNQGTTFKIYLPAEPGSAAELDASSRTSKISKGTETILLAEDNDMVRELAVAILERQGYAVLPAASGAECLRMLPDLNESLDLLITDVIMPDMNGKALFQLVATQFPRVKVLYMSGYTDDVIVHHGVLDEGIAFIQKPFTVQSLAAKVREVLES
jgi:two-component system cell cycle sensor histidine kinase/response regulator CckA